MATTAGILIIGDEILSGKIQDENAPFLLRELRRQGVDVPRVHTIPDEIDIIAHDVRLFSKSYDYVLTSGGLGPTHDDLTMDGVAKAFDQKLVQNARMTQMLESSLHGSKPNASQIKMCMLPEGTELIESPELWFPLIRVENVFIFPGIPRLLQAKFESLRDTLSGTPLVLRRIFMICFESDVAEDLHTLLREFPELRLGSYPRVADEDYRTMLTLESRDADYVDRALNVLVGRIPASAVVRVE